MKRNELRNKLNRGRAWKRNWKTLLEDMNVSGAEASAKMGSDRTTLCRIIAGYRDITFDEVRMLEDGLLLPRGALYALMDKWEPMYSRAQKQD